MAVRTLARYLVLAGTVALATPALPKELGGPGPQPPVWPRPGQKDWQLYEKAVRLQSGMWWHLSPEGLLVTIHREGATPDELSEDVVKQWDTAIWTGCYAASQACRWKVTRDPDALRQCIALARGMALLSDATGVPGRFVRSVGRVPPGQPLPEACIPSPSIPGLVILDEVSRDQLCGMILGWACLLKFVEDPEVQAIARKQVTATARRIWADEMWLRNSKGEKQEFGEMRPDVEQTRFLRKLVKVRNGMLASMGFATVLVARMVDPAPDLMAIYDQLVSDEWDDAMEEQHTWAAALVNASNVNMVNCALLAVVLHGVPFEAEKAQKGMRSLRKATIGWWNAGYTACQLMAGIGDDDVIGETRATLHDLPELEVYPGRERWYHAGRIATLQERAVLDWNWSDNPTRAREWIPWEPGERRITTTRADWLFAYWIARAAGYLRPLAGPGADPTGHRIAPRLPPWMSDASAPGASPAGSGR